jgi:hypothetical protein
MEAIRNVICSQTKEQMGRCQEGYEVAESWELDKVLP